MKQCANVFKSRKKSRFQCFHLCKRFDILQLWKSRRYDRWWHLAINEVAAVENFNYFLMLLAIWKSGNGLMLIKQCSVESDRRSCQTFFISLKAQLFVLLLDLYSYLFSYLYSDKFLFLLDQIGVHFKYICALSVQNLSEHLTNYSLYIWKPNCLYFWICAFS